MNILLIGGCGYIGGFLYPRLLSIGASVTICDLLKRGNPSGSPVLECDYAQLDISFLERFDTVLWFAGHSSVGESVLYPSQAVQNNCLNLFSFAKRLPIKTRLIYASTGSLYSTTGDFTTPAREDSLVSIPSQNAYDVSKFAFDYLASHFLAGCYGLRIMSLYTTSRSRRAGEKACLLSMT
ncbi:NAD-dependent epimerase/dehydratase family protein [Trinickia acidisoli]|uniref:NAD-dependent epimerase/dehydratase family protein n=1 Tax=Trinickia acidisoli TaxID=2767482 RepID=UPI001A8CE796|nr:NAD(P)-dependent oxidoreductase [Trinickia acidisoli]